MVDLDLLGDPLVARTALAGYLRDGALCLIIGAGASKGLGFPLWDQLISECYVEAGLGELDSSGDLSGETLRLAAERIEEKLGYADFTEMVNRCLYKGVTYDESVIGNRLMAALGALLMGSRRGHISSVFNFNFDDSLEWYLRLHGFAVAVVTKLPLLQRAVDVTLYHPHGYLPSDDTPCSDFLILSQFSFDKRMGERKDLWKEAMVSMLRRRVGIFIGLSGDDPEFGPLLGGLVEELRDRPTGFWFLKKGDCRRPDSFFKRRNVVPLRVESYDHIPDYIFKVCQAAAKDLKT